MAKLIFYSTMGPDLDDEAWSVFNMVKRAVDKSLDAEVVLAGPATGLLRRHVRERIEGRQAESLRAVLEAGVPIWVSPGCAAFRGVSAEEMAEVGAQPRELAEMLCEVAAGAQLVPFIG